MKKIYYNIDYNTYLFTGPSLVALSYINIGVGGLKTEKKKIEFIRIECTHKLRAESYLFLLSMPKKKKTKFVATDPW